MNLFSSLRCIPFTGALLLGVEATSAHAATFSVSNLNDSGAGSLRAAVELANADATADTISFALDLAGTVTLSSAPLVITSSVSIEGRANQRVSISGNNQRRLFSITGASTQVSLSYLTVANGYASSQGAAILNEGSLRVQAVTFSGNVVRGVTGRPGRIIFFPGSRPTIVGQGEAGGNARGSAIYSSGSLVVADCTFANNSAIGGTGGTGASWASGSGGAGGSGGRAQGGAIYSSGALGITNSTFANNSAVGGAGGKGGNGRRPGSAGLGGESSAGAIYCTQGVKMDSCTLCGNSANQGGALNIEATGIAQIYNSLLAGNNGGDVRGSFDSRYNFIGGTAMQAGLRTTNTGLPLLQYNGGPTPTVALLSISPVINVGTTTLAFDQRGMLRDAAPDIGAFELPDIAPRVESLSPLNVSDKVGAKRTFSITVSDPKSASEIKEIWLLLNERLSWNAGATLIYVPKTTTPTKGQLFLRSGDAFLPPVDIGVGSRAVLDNGAVSISAREVGVSVSGNSVTLNLPLTIRDGLVGVNRVFARVVNKAGLTDLAAIPSDGGYRRFGNYTVTPQFNGATNSVPTLSKLTPTNTNTSLSSAGLGPVQNFTFSAADADGTGDIESIWLMAGKAPNWKNSATFIYTPRTRRLTLRSDDGNTALGGGVVGTPGIIENSQVRVDLSKVRIVTNGDDKTLGIILPLQAKRGLIGQNKVWLRAQDNERATAPNGDAQGYVQSGTWNVVQGSASPMKTSQLSNGNS
ncbi:hypothetical protein EON83_29340 [bacterium]|nr:MAG: hypothetical protein EON83_29340 [bacterium]